MKPEHHYDMPKLVAEQIICKLKIGYNDGPTALSVSKQHSKKYNNTMTPYRCPHCNKWHLRSSKVSWKKQVVRGQGLC